MCKCQQSSQRQTGAKRICRQNMHVLLIVPVMSLSTRAPIEGNPEKRASCNGIHACELTSPILPQPMTPTPRGSSAIRRDDADLVAAAAGPARNPLSDAWGRTNAEALPTIRAARAAHCTPHMFRPLREIQIMRVLTGAASKALREP